ncbi:MAG: thioredoxin domain-containing protein [Myxococcota bacterium]|nr:thioredoxin domain-containing protein [Myxococcota bacterium]
MDRLGATVIAAALILGGSIVAAAWMVSSAVNDANATLSEVEGALSEAVSDLGETLAKAAPARAAEPRRRGPDPAKVYSLATAGAPALGPETAKVTVVEFSDFQCPYCSRVYPTLLRLRQEYGDDVRIVFKHMPLAIHSKAPAAHAAAEAAKLQGQFWAMHDKIFAGQRLLSDAQYEAWAKEIGLDVERFKQDLASRAVKDRVDADLSEAQKLGVTGTPAFFINGRFLSGAQPFANFKRMIDDDLKG